MTLSADSPPGFSHFFQSHHPILNLLFDDQLDKVAKLAQVLLRAARLTVCMLRSAAFAAKPSSSASSC
jgi:hypothetical protein